MGLVIDNSGSMREKREQVNSAALTFVKTSNPQDEAFVVNFNDEYYLDTDGDFTSDQQDLNNALSRIDTRGSTALYDAVIGSIEHLHKAHKDKRVLLVITDGDDDASRKSLSDTMKAAEQSNAAIYAIGVFSADDRKNDKKMVRRSTKELKELTEVTGGMAYFPETLDEVKPPVSRSPATSAINTPSATIPRMPRKMAPSARCRFSCFRRKDTESCRCGPAPATTRSGTAPPRDRLACQAMGGGAHCIL